MKDLVNAEIHTATAPLTSLTCCKNYIKNLKNLKNLGYRKNY